MNKKKILMVLGHWENGGIEKVITAYCRDLYKSYLIDIFSFSRNKSIFDDEMNRYGIKIISSDNLFEGNIVKRNLNRTHEFLKIASRGYDIIHYHTSFAIAYLHCKALKKKCPNTRIILHSHGDNINPPYKHIKVLVNTILKNIYKNVPDYCLACSTNAGLWLFSKYAIVNKFEPLMNPIRLENYKFGKDQRKRQRTEWNVNGEYLVGTIGRIEYQKNPEFIVEIIKKLEQRDFNYKFVWIGNGPDENIIKNQIKSLNLENEVIFVARTEDIPSALSAMDVFILPSRYEGLALVLLEAQASGLKVFASNTTSAEAGISDTISWIPIDDASLWAEKIVKSSTENQERRYPKEGIRMNGFDYDYILGRLNETYKKILGE